MLKGLETAIASSDIATFEMHMEVTTIQIVRVMLEDPMMRLDAHEAPSNGG